MLDPKQTETILLVFLFVCAPSALAGARRGLYRAVRVRERSSFDSRSYDFLANILAVESFFSVNHGVVLSGFQSRSDQAVAQLFLKLAAKSMP